MNAWGFLVGAVTLALNVFAWWVKANDDKVKLKASLEKEVDDAIASGSVSGVSALIERIDRLR